MANGATEPEFDVVIVGSGVAGALVAHRMAEARLRVTILEAGGVAPDSLGRSAMVNSYATSPSKATDSPFCGEDILAPQPAPVNPTNYYDYDNNYKKDQFKSFYQRLIGGSTWHWQGLWVRMLPNDFRMKSEYGAGVDWPLTYHELEPWYAQAEYEMGVAGDDDEVAEYLEPRFGAYRSRPYPMPGLAPSFLDSHVASAVDGRSLSGIPLRVTSVAHAVNSRPFDGRPACDGHSSCVPLCPIKARYEAVVHVQKAVAAGAILRSQAVVTRLDLDQDRKQVTRVWYRRWTSRYSGGLGQYRASEERSVSGAIVVLAANGIENPMILLRSDAGNSSDAVGRYLMDHPIKQSFALAAKPLFPFRGPQTTSNIESFRDGAFRRIYAGFKTSIKNDGWSNNPTGAPRGYFMPPTRGPTDQFPGSLLDLVHNWGYAGKKLRETILDHATRQITLSSACEQLAMKENRVMKSKRLDSLGIPRPLIQYMVDDENGYVRRSFRQIVQLHSLVFDAMGIAGQNRMLQLDPDDQPLSFGGSGHIIGTTTMGSDPRTSVVDKNCRSHDHPNLYILGSSVFPTTSTANPTSTIAALSIRAAEAIKRRLRTGGVTL